MILIDGIKFSCLECIRGHRSTLCRHHMRALLQVRSKGRPNVMSRSNKNHRIAVFAEQIADDPDELPGNCKDTPVVILKASDKHVIDVSNGQIVGPYAEYESGTPVISAESFVNSSPCCSQGVSKVRKSCSCNQKKVLKHKILDSYLKKRQPGQLSDLSGKRNGLLGKADRGSCCGSKTSIPKPKSCCDTKEEPGSTEILAATPMENGLHHHDLAKNGENKNNKVGPNGVAEAGNGIAANGKPNDRIKFEPQLYNPVSFRYEQPMAENIDFASFAALEKATNAPGVNANGSNGSLRDSSTPSTALGNIVRSEDEVFEVINVESCSIPGSCRCSDDCSCPNCIVHNNAPAKSDALRFLNNDAQYCSNLVLTLAGNKRFREDPLLPRDLLSYTAFLHQLIGEDNESGLVSPQNEEEKCSCADDSCFCSNCEKHGIIEGYRLDDLFGSKIFKGK